MIDTQYIIDFLEKKLPKEEQKQFEEQIASSKELQKEVNDITLIWKTSSDLRLQRKVDVSKKWNIIARKIHRDRINRKVLYFARNAAALLILPVLLLTGFLYFKVDGGQNDQEIQILSASGTVTKTTLPDGTEVWLNSASKLIYPQKFTEHKRVVYLIGEAYFKVQSDKSNRFDVVLYDGLTVSAYGTEFNINSYDEDQTIDVTLVKGSIEVNKKDNSISREVIPGQHLAYNKEDKSMKIEDAYLAVKTGWIEGKMVFRRASMTEVVQRLSRHFNVGIRLEEKELYDYEYSATFTTETLNEILRLLQKTAPIKYREIESVQSDDDKSFSKRIIIISLDK